MPFSFSSLGVLAGCVLHVDILHQLGVPHLHLESRQVAQFRGVIRASFLEGDTVERLLPAATHFDADWKRKLGPPRDERELEEAAMA